MRKLAILGTRHQELGDAANAHFGKVLSLIIREYKVQVIFEEWSATRLKSFAHHVAEESGLAWTDVGTPNLPEFETYDEGVDRLGFDWRNPSGVSVPRYGPVEKQRARELAMVNSIGCFTGNWESGLLIIGANHLHSMIERLNESYTVEGFSWFPPA